MSLVDKGGEAMVSSMLDRIRALENEIKYLKRIEVPKKSEISTNFTDLHDTPTAYTDQAGKYFRVNATEDGLDFIDPPAV